MNKNCRVCQLDSIQRFYKENVFINYLYEEENLWQSQSTHITVLP